MEQKSKKAIRISVIAIIGNVLLAALKLIAGFYGNSKALIADAIHSLSDVLATFIVVGALLLARKAPDKEHQYGHQRYESLASLLLGLILAGVGVKIGYDGILAICTGSYKTLPVPSLLTAIAAAVSIVIKELMYQVTIRVAKEEKSNALKADAWHHRSDALSSVGSLIGVVFARFGMPVMDSVACIVICFFIVKVALEILIDAVKALTDCSAGDELCSRITETVLGTEGVLCIDELKTRIFGSGYYADIEIAVDGSRSLGEAHDIAEKVHDEVERNFPEIWHCMVHVNPGK